MEQVLEFVGRHGPIVVFIAIFLDQLGLPIPTIPILLVFGALAGAGRIDPVTSLLVAVIGCLCADVIWFLLGRWKGGRVLGGLCAVALEPDSCVSKTHDLFATYGVKSLLVAKFIPGFDTVAPPLAGLVGVRVVPFLLWSCGGALLWLGTFAGLGYLFSNQVDDLAALAERFQGAFATAVFALLAAYLAWKYYRRQRILRSIRMARIAPKELYDMIVGGRAPIIIDARSASALAAVPFVIEGAHHLTADQFDEQHVDISWRSEVVVYCSCPNELSSARLALKLQRLGIQRVRPLYGGIEAWRAMDFPVVP